MERLDILNTILQGIGNIQSDKLFIRDVKSGSEYSYGEFFSIAQRLAKQLKEHYTELVVCKENSFELCCLLFACLIGNVIVIPMDPRKEDRELGEILRNHQYAKWIIDKEEKYRDEFDYSFSKDESVSIIEVFKNVDYDKDYLVTYTSGTTGVAKGVIHSAGSLFVNAYMFGFALGLRNCCLAHIMPMSYMAGILNSIILPFVMGGQIVIFPRFDVNTMSYFWKNIDNFPINIIWMTPTMLNMISHLDKKGKKAEYIKKNNITFCVGTASLPLKIRERFEQLFQTRVYQSYGLTELLLLSTENYETDVRYNSVGKPLEGVEMKLENEELLVRVPWHFKGYTNENAEACFRDGFYKTGDVAKWQGDNLFISGRRKEMIIRGGMKINPHEIEKVIYRLSDVKECKVDSIIVDDEERICCYLVTNKSNENCEEKIKRLVRKELGKVYSIDYFIKLDEIPKNLNGKVDSIKLKDYANSFCKQVRL